MSFETFQKQLLSTARSKYTGATKLSERVERAFLEVPRHLFVERYRIPKNPEWFKVGQDHLEQHLAHLYADQPVVLFGNDEDFEGGRAPVSTISQPSFVLRLIDLLEVREGDKVFELGCASGWNAALLSRMAGATGKVVSAEIIPELANSARERLARMGYENVKVLLADGGDGSVEDGPFDCAMFTAGAFDLPRPLFRQVKEGGLLLFVLKSQGLNNDVILKLRKCGGTEDGYFRAEMAIGCGFVPMTGKYQLPEMEEANLREYLQRKSMPPNPMHQRPFWWGTASSRHFGWNTSALRSYLSLSSQYLSFANEEAFGWTEANSLAVATAERLDSYGSTLAADSLLAKIKEWVELGMPTWPHFEVSVYPSNVDAPTSPKDWVLRRREATFVWSQKKFP